MDCPACNKILKNVKNQSQTVGLCESCGGFWFEHDRLHKMIEKLALDKKVSYRQMQQVLKGKQFLGKRRKPLARKCPRCNIDMNVLNFSYNSEVFLDKCPFCKGIWTDKRDRVNLTQYLEGNTEVNFYIQTLIEARGKFLKKQEDKRKHIAIGLAIAYLVLAFGFGDKGTGFRLLIFLTFPLFCIFFGKKTDSLIKFSFNLPLGTKTINITSGKLVVISGWGLLFLPLISALVRVIFG